jgi:menaquinone-dependent protoporphyrinogen oxidase
MKVLVAYATMNGSTAEIAEWIGDELRAAGFEAEVRAAKGVSALAGYQAVILGGAIYLAAWHPEARRFVRRFAGGLRLLPVWLFGSGPLDTSAEETELEPIPSVLSAMRAVGARGHITFGGRVNEEGHGYLGYLARQMTANGRGGDFRNPQRVRAWARGIAAQLRPGWHALDREMTSESVHDGRGHVCLR